MQIQKGLCASSSCALGRLLTITAETIDFEDHGDFVVIELDDLRWLESIACELANEFARSDDGTN